jgi:hypothetical protein
MIEGKERSGSILAFYAALLAAAACNHKLLLATTASVAMVFHQRNLYTCAERKTALAGKF